MFYLDLTHEITRMQLDFEYWRVDEESEGSWVPFPWVCSFEVGPGQWLLLRRRGVSIDPDRLDQIVDHLDSLNSYDTTPFRTPNYVGHR